MEGQKFVKNLSYWKKNNWVLFASMGKVRFWCNMEGKYRVTRIVTNLIAENDIFYEGNDMKKAALEWDMGV